MTFFNLGDTDDIKPKAPTAPPDGVKGKDGRLKLTKREGYIWMEMTFLPDTNDVERGQSAGDEMDDALERARKLWEFGEAKLKFEAKGVYQTWEVVFPG